MKILLKELNKLVDELMIEKVTLINRSKVIHSSKILLCKLYQIVNDINILLERDSLNSIHILMRPIIHIVVDLKNIITDEKYTNKIALKYAKNELNKLNKKESNRPLKPSDKQLKKQYEKNISELEQESVKVISEKKKFNILNDDNAFYTHVYSKLSDDSHANIGYLTYCLSEIRNGKIKYKIKENVSGLKKGEIIRVLNVIILESVILIKKINNIDYESDKSKLEMYYSNF